MAVNALNNLFLGLLGASVLVTGRWENNKGNTLPASVQHEYTHSLVFPSDTTKNDTTKSETYKRSTRPVYRPRDRYGDPLFNRTSSSPLLLRDPQGLKLGVELDTGMNYTITERLGEVDYRAPSTMTFEEFKRYQDQKILQDYWRTRTREQDGEGAVGGRSLMPQLFVSPVFDRIFGGTEVDIVPRGFVTLDFGGRWQRVDNPAIPIRQQRNGGFEFDQQISMNVTGTIGDKMAVTANFDNNQTFDLQNNLKVEYTGYQEDILQKLEIGNVSLPLNNSLISGAQNLFGIKAQMQFGKLFVTTVASTQRGKTESLVVEGGGAMGRPFEIIGSNYDENRHFFLGQYFRRNFERWVSSTPMIRSGVNITRVEVYVLNRNNDTQTLRNVVALMDLGEAQRLYNSNIAIPDPNAPIGNASNNLFSLVSALDKNTDVINAQLDNLFSNGLVNGTEYEKINSARKLAPNEYTVHPELGYITLLRKLQNDEALAVSYEYSVNGRVFKVGELSEDYGPRPDNEVILLKMLRPRKVNIRDSRGRIIPSWDLMMKNIYSMNATQISRENFQLRLIYRDDRTGIDNPQLQEGTTAGNRQLLEIMGLDRLNQNNDPQPDGNFDFVERITINAQNGLIIFPFLEPLNTPLRREFDNDPPQQRSFLINKYVYDTLYRTTRADAELDANRNKFFLVGKYQAGSSSEINIPEWNLAPGSVKVYAGGAPLREGMDYQVDYNFGKVTILNEGVLNSGKTLTINYEKADLFNFQTRTLLGTRLDYQLSEDVNFGGTMLYLNERPLISRVSIGNEPARNMLYGFDMNIRKDSRFLTKMVDALPMVQTKEPSTVTFSAEFAQLVPGTSNVVDGEGTSYIDDFENSITPFNLGAPATWKLAATPQTDDRRYDLSTSPTNDLGFGYKRAKLAWYMIDNLFYRSTGRDVPSNITSEDLQNHYVRGIKPQEIFPKQDEIQGRLNYPILDLAYYPTERGPYNFNPSLTLNGTLSNPRSNWGGVTAAITTEVDFDKANIEYIEFWLMDPFIDSPRGVVDDGINTPSVNTTGGDLYFNLGSISEDVIKDGRMGFENGLPADGSEANVVETAWGRVTTGQPITNAFDNRPEARANQDVGLNGLSNAAEREKFAPYLASFPPGSPARVLLEQDPAGDDFQYFLGGNLDARNAKILERYKNFNGLERNSPVNTGNQGFVPAGSPLPDTEDLNRDNTLNELEEYYEYKVSLQPGQLNMGNKYIVDRVTNNINGDEVSWYLFRIPIRQFDGRYGNISDFKSIRYIRTYLTNFTQPVVLRMANFRLVGNQWRRYLGNLEEARFGPPLEGNPYNFTVSVVNIEENSQGNETQPPYIEPPGFRRDRDNTSALERRLNEQSIQICVEGLEDSDARAIYKNFSGLDLVNYGRVKMFLHANSTTAQDDEVSAFIRLGTDFDQNYYEIEIPLKITEPNTNIARAIWPEENEIDLAFNELFALKSGRTRDNFPIDQIYPRGGKQVGRHTIRILGRPDISDVRTIMIGVRNPRSPDGTMHNVCIWANELRVTDFNREAGWAANALLNVKLADLANITTTVRHSTFGFGGIQSRIPERTREETTALDVSANIAVDKLLPQSFGLQIPMFVSYEQMKSTPRFDPKDPDIPLEASLLSLPEQDRKEYRRAMEMRSTRRSINFSNVRKMKTREDAPKRIYDIENLSVNFAYSDHLSSDFRVAEFLRQNYRGGIGYTYSPTNEPWEPFKNWEKMKSPYLNLVKDFNFNPVPTNITIRADLDRQFVRTTYRGENLLPDQSSFYEKYFTFRRNYNLRWNLTKNLSVDYSAFANAIIDEPDGDINSQEKRDSVWVNFKNFGRMKDFNQRLLANYKVPFDKLPMVDWLSTETLYEVAYSWSAGPINLPDSLNFGNTIQNSRTQSANGRIDMVKLYNKVKFLKDINQPPRQGRTPTSTAPPGRTATPPPGQPKEEEEAPKKENKALKSALKALMMVRTVNFNASIREGTVLPGFAPTASLFGLDSGFVAPGIPFLLGSQSPNIRQQAAENGWLVRNPDLSIPFTQTRTVDLSARANVEPFNEFKVQLDVKKTKGAQFREIFRFEEIEDEFLSLNPTQSGTYGVTISTIRTAFIGDDDQNNSEVFETYTRNRAIIQQRLASENGVVDYKENSQDVLIPAFLAAYTGKDASKVSLSPFPNTPVPNWRLDYAGLTKVKSLKDVFTSIVVSHAYSSNYAVMNFTSSMQYEEGVGIDNKIEDYNRSFFATQSLDNTDPIPVFVITNVMISEKFSPLIGVNFRTKSQFSGRMEYRTQRDLSLNTTNFQVSELNRKEVALELGYTKTDWKLPFKSSGRTIVLKNDIQFRMNVAIGETMTIQRKVEEAAVVTSGNLNFQLRPNVNYAVNQKLNLQVYFERNVNEPKVSNAFKRATTRFGAQLRFSLTQ